MDNKIKKGYKNTEIGVIPEEWEVIKIGDLAEIATGNTPPTDDRTNYGIDYLFVSPADLGNIKWIDNSEKKLSKKGFSISRKFPKDSILFTCIGSTIGKSGISKFELTSNQQINAVFPNENYNSEFAYYELQIIAKEIKAQAGEQAVPMVNKSSFAEFKIPLPPLPEQTAIATVLSDTDSLIQALEKKIAKKQLIKKGAMQRCLNPDFNDLQDNPDLKNSDSQQKSSNQDNQKNQGARQWEVKTLGEIGQIITGSTPPTLIKEYWNGTIPWITPTDISTQKDIFHSEREISVAGLNVIRKLPENTLLVTCIASIGKNAILREKGACNQQINAIIPNEDNSVDFLYYLIEINRQYILGKAGITATLLISKKDFAEIVFSFPKSLEEQTRIAQILSDMDSEIEALKKKLAKYKQIKQGLMQVLLTGKKRLINCEL